MIGLKAILVKGSIFDRSSMERALLTKSLKLAAAATLDRANIHDLGQIREDWCLQQLDLGISPR